jgi:glucokinase
MLMKRAVVGVDLGATKTAVALATARGHLLAEGRFPTPSSAGAAVKALKGAITGLLRRRRMPLSSLRAIAVGVPGVCDVKRGIVIWAPNLKGWRRVPLGRALAAWAGCPVRLENDADMAVRGEAWRGAARGLDHVVMLTVGTGIGGGIITNGQLLRGAGDVAGAAGWMRVGASRLEDVASGPAIGRRFTGDPASTERICRAAAAGHPAARRAVRAAAAALGLAAADLVSVLNPQAVVFGGGVMESAGRLMLPVIRSQVMRHAQPVAARQARIALSPLGNRAGVLGAIRTACLLVELER